MAAGAWSSGLRFNSSGEPYCFPGGLVEERAFLSELSAVLGVGGFGAAESEGSIVIKQLPGTDQERIAQMVSSKVKEKSRQDGKTAPIERF